MVLVFQFSNPQIFCVVISPKRCMELWYHHIIKKFRYFLQTNFYLSNSIWVIFQNNSTNLGAQCSFEKLSLQEIAEQANTIAHEEGPQTWWEILTWSLSSRISQILSDRWEFPCGYRPHDFWCSLASILGFSHFQGGVGLIFFEMTRNLSKSDSRSGIQFTMLFIEFVVCETQWFDGSNANLI